MSTEARYSHQVGCIGPAANSLSALCQSSKERSRSWCLGQHHCPPGCAFSQIHPKNHWLVLGNFLGMRPRTLQTGAPICAAVLPRVTIVCAQVGWWQAHLPREQFWIDMTIGRDGKPCYAVLLPILCLATSLNHAPPLSGGRTRACDSEHSPSCTGPTCLVQNTPEGIKCSY